MFRDSRELARRLGAARPLRITNDSIKRRAATALVVIQTPEPEILFMIRATRVGDPWSGQVSLPGGHAGADEELSEAARRESSEELGLALAAPLGRLDDQQVHTGPHTVVTPYVFALAVRPPLQLDAAEASGALFVPISHLLDPGHRTSHEYERSDGSSAHFPGIQVDDSLIWGLTYRSLANFFKLWGHELPLPPPPGR